MFTINSEVSGVVYEINVKVGEVVNAQDVVLFIESMKMEISHQAPCAGRIKEIHVEVGQAVDEGATLITCEKNTN